MNLSSETFNFGIELDSEDGKDEKWGGGEQRIFCEENKGREAEGGENTGSHQGEDTTEEEDTDPIPKKAKLKVDGFTWRKVNLFLWIFG